MNPPVAVAARDSQIADHLLRGDPFGAARFVLLKAWIRKTRHARLIETSQSPGISSASLRLRT